MINLAGPKFPSVAGLPPIRLTRLAEKLHPLRLSAKTDNRGKARNEAECHPE
jgi:hypothetical protein